MVRSPSPEAKRQKTDADGAESMSIEETNAMRAKLGLAPLEVISEITLKHLRGLEISTLKVRNILLLDKGSRIYYLRLLKQRIL